MDNDAIRENKALSFIAQLSQAEKQLRNSYPNSDFKGRRDFDAVAATRKEHSVPILKSFKKWLDTEKAYKRIFSKSPLRSVVNAPDVLPSLLDPASYLIQNASHLNKFDWPMRSVDTRNKPGRKTSLRLHALGPECASLPYRQV